jgi:hypothetical protein
LINKSLAQINLLKQNSGSSNFQSGFPKLLNKILIALLVLTIVYYGYLIWKSSQTLKAGAAVQYQINRDRTAALNLGQRNAVLTRQSQLKAYAGTIASHVYWSQLMPVLASSTLSSAIYSSLRASPDGSLDLTVTVPSLQDLDKYLQVFDQPQYNQYFSNIRISAFHKVQSASGNGLQFEVKFNFNQNIIKYAGQ